MPLPESVPAIVPKRGCLHPCECCPEGGKKVYRESLNHSRVGRNYKVNFPTTCPCSHFFSFVGSKHIQTGFFLRSLKFFLSVPFFFFFVTTVILVYRDNDTEKEKVCILIDWMEHKLLRK